MLMGMTHAEQTRRDPPVPGGWRDCNNTGLLMRPEHSEIKAKTETRECKTKTETETENKKNC